MASPEIKLHPSWKVPLQSEFEKPYMQALKAFLQQEKQSGAEVYPKGGDMFNALNTTPLDNVKVVILGQDPYHGPGQAHGLSFSVRAGVALPPSLKNIYKELQADLGIAMPQGGNLTPWAEQGVLLLNSVLTVRQGEAASHQNKGWETFTDKIISLINAECNSVVFILWGSYAQTKGRVIDARRHCILKAPHPSPLSAHRGFFGSRPFSKANEYLVLQGKAPINWTL